MGKPLKKSKSPAADVNDRLPSKSSAKCNHQRKVCFRVKLNNGQEVDTFHWPDEGGAVLFAMRHSRSLGTSADVYGPDGNTVCTFQPRTYEVAAVLHEWTEYNERVIGQDIIQQRNDRATADRVSDRTKSTKPLSKVAPKKKVLKKK